MARSNDTRPSLETFSYGLVNPGIPPKLAIRYPAWSRKVTVGPAERIPAALADCRHIMSLRVEKSERSALPSVIGKLEQLRFLSLSDSKKITRLPPSIFALPRLERLYLGGTGIKSLEGVEHAPALRSISLIRTPLARNKAKLNALVASIPHASLTEWMAEIEIDRPGAIERPATRRALLAAVRDEATEDMDLSGVDLSGTRFANLSVRAETLRRANLRNSRWTRCDFSTDLDHANLEGATFEECIFTGSMEQVRARRATFRGCFFCTTMEGGDLREARFTAVEPRSILDLGKAQAQKLQMEVVVTSPRKEAVEQIQGHRADLRDARIRFELTAEARAALERTPDPRAAWAIGGFKGAQTNAATRIEYAALPGAWEDHHQSEVILRGAPGSARGW